MIDTFCCEPYSRAVLDGAILETEDGSFILGSDWSTRFNMKFCPFCGTSFDVLDPDWEWRDGRE